VLKQVVYIETTGLEIIKNCTMIYDSVEPDVSDIFIQDEEETTGINLFAKAINFDKISL
jgi:hypothetical protein